MKHITFGLRIVYCTLVYWATALIILPAMASNVEILPVVLEKTGLNFATNGVPVIDIATPNSDGLSYNIYHHFNVGSEGLILNNSTADQTPTQLAGMIDKNPHLTDKSANVIINEVVSPNPSELKGLLEIAGTSASVMVANPYGITCDGCHFINTPSVTLATDTSYFIGEEDRLITNNNNGKITIQGSGIDARDNDYLALLSRTIAINAKIQAKNLSVIAGRNRAHINETLASQSGNNLVPMLAIDTGALGGMYAEKIELISNEQGVGVNLNNVNTASGNVQIDVNGQLTFGNATSPQDINMAANQLHLTGKQTVINEINLHSRGETQLNNAILSVGNQLTMIVDGEFISNASHLASRALNIYSRGNISQDSDSIFTAGQLGINGQRLSLAGQLKAYNHLGVTGSCLQGKGTSIFESGDNILITVGEYSQWAGKMMANEKLEIYTGNRLENQGSLIGHEITLSADFLVNNPSGHINTHHLKATGQQWDNYGEVSVSGMLNLAELKNLNNQGVIDPSESGSFLTVNTVITAPNE